MKGTFFSKPLEWSIETEGEAWQQGGTVKGVLKVKNHHTAEVPLDKAGVGLAYAEVKKVHARTEGVMRPTVEAVLPRPDVGSSETLEFPFSLTLPANSPVSDKKGSYFLTYGQKAIENHLQLKVEPLALYGKVIGLLDTFQRFKLKEYKTAKNGVEYKLIPPTSREMANMEALSLTFSMKEELLQMAFDFQVKKLDTSSVTTKIKKESVKVLKEMTPKDYSLGRDMINQDQLLKVLEAAIGEVKIKNAF